jgi:hypothetical protein
MILLGCFSKTVGLTKMLFSRKKSQECENFRRIEMKIKPGQCSDMYVVRHQLWCSCIAFLCHMALRLGLWHMDFKGVIYETLFHCGQMCKLHVPQICILKPNGITWDLICDEWSSLDQKYWFVLVFTSNLPNLLHSQIFAGLMSTYGKTT